MGMDRWHESRFEAERLGREAVIKLDRYDQAFLSLYEILLQIDDEECQNAARNIEKLLEE